MKPLDPRLRRYTRPARGLILAAAVVIVAQAALTVGAVFVLAGLLADAVDSRGHEIDTRAVVAFALLAAVRAGLSWAGDVLARRAATTVTAALRGELLAHALRLGPLWLGGRRRGELTALVTRGIAALEPFVARYLPTLVTATVVPVLSVAVIGCVDPLSALIVLGTLPLVPLFGALVGAATQRCARRQWQRLAGLAGHFADVVAGLPTLVAHGRARAQTRRIAEVTRAHCQANLATLRLAFASSAVLELVATISVAGVAVSVGLRVINGSLSLGTGLVVLLLAPEAYWPLRRLGAEFHAAAEGLAAIDEVTAVLAVAPPPAGTARAVPDPRRARLAVTGLQVTYPDRDRPALGPLTAGWGPGGLHAIAGPSGCGKSTLFAALLGFVPVGAGTITLGAASLRDVDPAALRAQLAWIPQQPALPPGPLDDAVRMLRPAATDAEVDAALAAVGLREVVAALPRGRRTVLDGETLSLSAGERARLALARALVSGRALVLLDEPTDQLDRGSEDLVLSAVQRLARSATVLMVTHRRRMLAAADSVTLLSAPTVPTVPTVPGRAPLRADVLVHP